MLRKKCDDCQKPQWIWRLALVGEKYLCFDCADKWMEGLIKDNIKRMKK